MTDDPLDRFFTVTLSVLVAVCCLLLVGMFSWVLFGGAPYSERIEAKYDIDVIDIAGKYGDGTVTFIDSDGRTCAASQAPDDVLVFLGCQELDR